MKKISQDPSGVIRGVEKLSHAVGSTLGALGHTVFIEQGDGKPPIISKDGYEVSGFVASGDSEEQLGISVVRQATKRTADSAGDGSTTSTVIAGGLIKLGYSDDYPAVKIVSGIRKAAEDVVLELEGEKQLLTDSTMRHIAEVSTNNDKHLGGLICDVFLKAGNYGGVDYIIDPTAMVTTAEYTPGSVLQLGYPKPAFINDHNHGSCTLKNPLVLVSKAKIKNIKQIASITEYALKEGRPLVIFGETTDEVDETLISNNVNGDLKTCAVRTHEFTDKALMEDLACLTGAVYFDNYSMDDLSLVTPEMLGEMTEISVFNHYCVFTVGELREGVEERQQALKVLIEEGGHSELKIKDLQERLGLLSSSFGKIIVGAPTDAERGEIYRRVEDAVKAIATAKRFGYLPGGGVALRDIAIKLKKEHKKEDTGESHGYRCVLEAIAYPYYKILENAGIEEEENLKRGYGYNVLNGEVVDMVLAGIIDPAGVVSGAFVNAVSASVAILGTKVIITNTVEDEKEVSSPS